jgi:filamentous hemagglutinin
MNLLMPFAGEVSNLAGGRLPENQQDLDAIAVGSIMAVGLPMEIPSPAGSVPQVVLNRAQGKAFEQVVKQDLVKTQDNVVEQVMVKTQSGIRTVLDFLGVESSSGIVQATEAKSSLTAPLTPAQAAAHPEMAASGATVVGQGKPPFTGGTVIPPTEVKVVRPPEQPKP